jgi:L-serine dehydratase
MFLSVFDIFKIGIGPSSSHTMGPMLAAARFLDALRAGADRVPGSGAAARIEATLHGSLAFTGKGHATDRAVVLGLLGFLPETLDPDRAAALQAELRTARRIYVPGLGAPPSTPKPASSSTTVRRCPATPTASSCAPSTRPATFTSPRPTTRSAAASSSPSAS